MPPPQGPNPEIGQFWRVSAGPFSCGVYTKCKKRGERDKRSNRDMFASLGATAEDVEAEAEGHLAGAEQPSERSASTYPQRRLADVPGHTCSSRPSMPTRK